MKRSAHIHTAAGFTMIFTLIVMSLALMLISYLMSRGLVFNPYADLVVRRLQAKQLVLSGIQVATAQLVAKPEPPKKEGDKDQKRLSDEQFLLMHILPSLNRWQTFRLKEEVEGIDALMRVSITSQEGKINLNAIYDFAKHEFINPWPTLLPELLKPLEKNQKAKDLFKGLSTFLKKQDHPLNDISQLLNIPEFAVFKSTVYYEPPTQDTKDTKRPFYLSDIFSLEGSSTFNPWLFSDSLLGVLDLPRARSDDKKGRSEKIEAAIKEFKPQAIWKDAWNQVLKPLYEKELQSLPKGIESMLSPSFTASLFYVLCEATVGRVTQRALVLIERIRKAENNKVEYTTAVKKLYWL